MKTRRTKLFSSTKTAACLLSFLAVSTFTACSSDEDLNNDGTTELTDGQITINVENYGEEQTVTRSTFNNNTLQTEMVDLGDGLRAEVSVEQEGSQAETHRAATRAGMANGHYTIYAVDNATGTRVTGTDSKVSGTVSGGVFTKDAGTKLKLNPGTYTFVCFNDAVTDNGTNLTVSNGADALIGTTTQTVSGTGWRVNFQMKHQTARVRFSVVAYSQAMSGVTATLSSTTVQPSSHTYAVKADNYTAATSTISSGSYAIPTTGTTDAVYVLANAFTTAYQYFLPGISGDALSLIFAGGTTYGSVNLAGKSITLPSSLATLVRNGSYTIKVKLIPAIYLFDDGTNGVLAEKGSRTPIGLVLGEKTNAKEGTAMALKDIFHGVYMEYDKRTTWTQSNNVQYGSYSSAIQDMDGYKYTWEGAGSADGVTVKGNDNVNYLAFYYAGHYGDDLVSQGISVSGTMTGRKWYLPAIGEWMLASKMFPKGTNPNGSGWGNYDATVNKTAIYNALTAAGGETLETPHGHSITIAGYYWASTDIDNQNGGSMDWTNGGTDKFGSDAFTYKSYPQNNVRAFVHF